MTESPKGNDEELDDLVELLTDWHSFYDEALENLPEETREFVEHSSWAGELHEKERKKLIKTSLNHLLSDKYIAKEEVLSALKAKVMDIDTNAWLDAYKLELVNGRELSADELKEAKIFSEGYNKALAQIKTKLGLEKYYAEVRY
jgi:hypothetical protein